MIIKLVKRIKPNIKVKIKPYTPSVSPRNYELSLLSIYQQAKEEYKNGETNLI